MIQEALITVKRMDITYGGEVSISFLPLSHSAAQFLDIFFPLACAGTVHFARPDVLKVTLMDIGGRVVSGAG